MTEYCINKEWSFDFDFSLCLGETYTKFMEGLKGKRVLGNKIGKRSYFPPKPFDNGTLELPTDWIECDGSGTVEAFTVYHDRANSVSYSHSGKLPDVPYVVGVIKIGDSEQCIIHLLSGVDPGNPEELAEKIKVGLKVWPVWAQERSGNILDIESFEPTE